MEMFLYALCSDLGSLSAISNDFSSVLAGVLEIRTVSEGGVLAIKGVKSQYYISMNRTGQLQGKVTFDLLKRTYIL